MRADGIVDPRFERVRTLVDGFLEADPEFSLQFAAYVGGDLVIDLAGGPDATRTSTTGVFSTSKGIAGIAVALLVEDGLLDLDARVADYWPDFACHGKGGLLVRQMLSHQAGLIGTADMEPHDIVDSSAAAERLAASRPVWLPGHAVGYHALTIGVLIEELFRRVAGTTLQAFYEERIRSPHDIDFYLGYPESEEWRYRSVLPMRPTREQAALLEPISKTYDSLYNLGFTSLFDEFRVADGFMNPNRRDIRQHGPGAFGAIGSAGGLAKAYAVAQGTLGGPPLLSRTTIAQVSQEQVWGRDRVMNVDASFAVVFQKPTHLRDFGSFEAFGHDGAGGALGFADPLYGLSFGYIPNPVQFPGGSDPKALILSRAIRECLQVRPEDRSSSS